MPALLPLLALGALGAWLALAGSAGAEEAQAPQPPQTQAQEDLNAQLLYRAAVGRAEDVAILLKQGASPNAANENGTPALAIAVDRWDEQAAPVTRLLVEAGAQVAYPNGSRYNPLLLAIKGGNAELVKFFLERKQNFYAYDERNQTALALAHAKGDPEIIQALEAAIRAEQERIRAERSTENLNKLVRSYTYGNCAYQYVNYYLKSGQDKRADAAPYLRYREEQTREFSQSGGKLQEIFSIAIPELERVANRCREIITQELDALVSNRNRREKGVGKKADIEKRCNRIASRWRARVVEDTQTPMPEGLGPRQRIEIEQQAEGAPAP